MKTPEEIKTDLVAWGTGVRIDIGCGESVPPVLKYMLNGVRSSDVCRDALSYIKQLEAQVPQWISVKDSMPEKYIWVLIAASGARGKYSIQALFDGNGWLLDSKDETGPIYAEKVTHWMPMPEPPKEEQK